MAELDPSLERMRALLSSYYGVQDDTDAAVDDAKDIDCSTFDMVSLAFSNFRMAALPSLAASILL